MNNNNTDNKDNSGEDGRAYLAFHFWSYIQIFQKDNSKEEKKLLLKKIVS